MIDDRLQDQRLAAGNGGAMAAVDGARRELRAGDDIGLSASPRLPERAGDRWRRRAHRRGGQRPCTGPRVAAAGLRAASPPRTGGKQPPQPLAELAAIIFAHGVIADRGGDLGEARLERGAALGRIEPSGLGLPHPQHVRERARADDHLVPPSRPPERTRSSGSCPSGRLANFRLLPGLSSGSARSTAR